MNGGIESGSGVSIAHAGAGRVQHHGHRCELPACVQQRARSSASTTASRRAARGVGAFPVAWTETASTGVEAFTIHTGVVVSGAFQPRDESFNFTDSCE